MFYVKKKISDSMEVSVEINDENVDLSEVFADGKGDLYSTSIYCSECSKKIKANYGCK